jgi:serine/threonine protein kinase
MLYQMLLHTGEHFRAAQLQVSPQAPVYFDTNCKRSSSCDIPGDAHLSISSGQLKKNPDIFHWPIEARLSELKVVSDEEATATVSLIGRCLRLDPAHRSTAAELLNDRWFDGME